MTAGQMHNKHPLIRVDKEATAYISIPNRTDQKQTSNGIFTGSVKGN